MASSTKRSCGRRLKRFTLLFLAMFVAIVLLALAEGTVLWMKGTRYVPTTAVERVTVTDYAVSADGKFAVSRIAIQRTSRQESASADIAWHDLGEQVTVRLHVDAHDPVCVAASPVDDSVAISCKDGAILMWRGSLRTGVHRSNGEQALRAFADTEDSLIREIVFSPDGSLLVGASMNRTYVWRCPSGEVLRVLPRTAGEHAFAAFAGDSRTLITCGDRAGEASLWDVVSGRRLSVVTIGQDSRVVEAALSPDGQLIALGADDTTVRVHDARTGQELSRVSAFSPRVVFSQDGRSVVTAAIDLDGYPLRLHDARSGELLGELRGHQNAIAGFVFAADGVLHSWDVRGGIRAWEADARSELWSFSFSEWASGNKSF